LCDKLGVRATTYWRQQE